MKGASQITIGAATAAAATAFVVVVLILLGSLTWPDLSGFKALIGLGFIGGPPWLPIVVILALIIAGGAMGIWAIRSTEYGFRVRAVVAVLVLVAAFIGWTAVWTVLRLGPQVPAVPFLPIYSALLTLAGLLIPLVVLFVPIALLWARIVESLVTRR
jgi:hypothetical protein